MSRFMTEEEIAAEQALMRQQRENELLNFARAAEDAAPVSDEAAAAVTPLDLLDSSNYTDRATRDARYEICKGCDRLFALTKSCRECGCFMGMKTWLKAAACPLPEPKWTAEV